MSSQYYHHARVRVPHPMPWACTGRGVSVKGKEWNILPEQLMDGPVDDWGWEQWGLTCQKILKLSPNMCQGSQLQLLRSSLHGDLCRLLLWYGNAPIDPCWRTYILALREAASEFSPLPTASLLWSGKCLGFHSFPATSSPPHILPSAWGKSLCFQR